MLDWNESVTHPLTGQSNPRFLHGVITPMFTPCNSDRSLDEPAIRSYVNYLIDSRSVTTLFARSGLGQMYEFTMEDAKRLIDIVTDQSNGRIPVMVGCSGVFRPEDPRPDPEVYTRQSIELSHYAERKGATAAVLVVPIALTRDREELTEETALAFYARVAEETSLPTVVYQPPETRRRFRASPSFIQGLASLRSVVGMKISTGNMEVFLDAARTAQRSDFSFIAGDETVFPFTLMIGGTGVIGQGCTTHPEILRAVYDRVMAQDVAGASRAALDTLEATRAPSGTSLIAFVVWYLKSKGVRVQPFSRYGPEPLPEEEGTRIAAILDSIRAPYMDSITR